MLKYTTPEMIFNKIDNEDVLTTSGTLQLGGDNGNVISLNWADGFFTE